MLSIINNLIATLPAISSKSIMKKYENGLAYKV